MKKPAITVPFSRMPIKWRLTIWSALLLFLLFAAYNAVQYVFVEQWMLKREETRAQQNMREILNYFLEKEASFGENEIGEIRSFLQKVNRQDQLLRVLDEGGMPIIVVSNDIPAEWVAPRPVTRTSLEEGKYSGNQLLVMRSPLTIFQFNGTIEIVKSTQAFHELTSAILYVMILCGLGAVVISGLGGMLLARQLLRPLQSMAETMRNVKHKGLHERVRISDNQDEISTLMKMFNEMMDQVEKSFQQQRQFVEDASHEFRTPVAIVEGHLSMLQRWGKTDPAILEESLEASIQEMSRLKGLVQELLVLTRVEQGSIDEKDVVTNPDQVIRTILKNMEVLYPSARLESELEGIADAAIVISVQHLEQILLILLDNAVKYSPERAVISVRGFMNKDAVCLEITDCGMGIPEHDLPLVMDRFYRVDKARSGEQGGHGLGLSIAKRLTERYKGTISLRSKENEGTTVSVCLQALHQVQEEV
ncbi:HAMP domain-containing sensor histidine kinase [Paenibacillus mendelii]|uniref:Signal transduction histidine-protein kinase ArlS n=1 Tax=Paenibacillus mendelii TaxID=206163 RepID=A0ABV6JAG0_9BACL|nr:HAMP domain-containing histidine kinase [Paenibacillus mendelii]MCQ6560736.1 HAMP domain-containing histidine kinase [Paenibacillus mendelii]